MVGFRSTVALALCLLILPGVAGHPEDVEVENGDGELMRERLCPVAIVTVTDGLYVTHDGDVLLWTGAGLEVKQCPS